MAIRTTQNAAAAQFLLQTQSIYSKLAKTQEQLNTGQRISRPSDDPYGASQVLSYDSELNDVKRFQANAQSSMGFLAAADSAIGSATDALVEIRSLALKAANGTNNLTDRTTIANQIQHLKENVRDAVNSRFGNQYLFSGTSTNSVPYPAGNASGVTTPNVLMTRIGDNQSVAINVTSQTLVGANGSNLFDDIDALINEITQAVPNPANIMANVTAIDARRDQMLTVRGQLGATSNRLESALSKLQLTEERLMSARSDIAEVDPTEVFLRFSQQQTAYQAALASGTQMLQMSILKFI